jgi:protein arginine N-methyltransferase 5
MATESDARGFSLQGDFQENRPMFTLGYHDSERETPLSELQYGYLLNQDASELMNPHGYS